MTDWFRHYVPTPPALTRGAEAVAIAAFENCAARKTCYPNWGTVMHTVRLGSDAFCDATVELENKGISSPFFPTTLLALESLYPLGARRPSANAWNVIRARIFERDDYTCTYCGERGRSLECDHIFPVARGGRHTDDNLTTACRPCNRSKRDKLLSEWRPN